MNFLAHFFLAFDDPDLMLGNFLADFLQKKEVGSLDRGLQLGIQLHQQIDAYTDAHPQVRQSVGRLRPIHRKYAPVLVDVFYDFFLHRNWPRYANQPFDVFSEQVYQVLSTHSHRIPPNLQAATEEMVAANWLQNYTHPLGLADTLERLSRRVSVPAHLMGALETLEALAPDLDADFNAFFPDLLAHTQAWRRQNRR